MKRRLCSFTMALALMTQVFLVPISVGGQNASVPQTNTTGPAINTNRPQIPCRTRCNIALNMCRRRAGGNRYARALCNSRYNTCLRGCRR